HIADGDLPSVLESGLRAKDVRFTQLSKGKSFGLLDGNLKPLSCENWAQLFVVLATQICIRMPELNHSVEPARALEDRSIEASWIIRRSYDDHTILRSQTIEAI